MSAQVIFVLGLVGMLPVTMAGNCKSGWTWDQASGRCYKMQTGEKTWAEAQLACANQGAELVPGVWNNAQCLAYEGRTCMDGWVKSPSTSKCYYFGKNNLKNWEDAKQFCNGYGATLAKPKSQEENEWLLQQTGQTFWISANDHGVEGNWVWEDGCPIEDFFWKSGEPNNLNDEDCGLVSSDWQKWNDALCHRVLAFACEV